MHPRAEELVKELHKIVFDPKIPTVARDQIAVWRDKYRDVKDFQGARFDGIVLHACNFSSFDFDSAEFINCNMRGCHLNGAKLKNAKFKSTSDTPADMAGIGFSRIEAKGVHFRNCDLTTAQFNDADLSLSFFSESNLRSTRFNKATLKDAMFREVEFDTTTEFGELCDAKNMQMSRYELACLGPAYGQLTVGNRMVMTVADDVAKLRTEFGGIWGILHFLALLVFAAPYAWFLAYCWSRTYFSNLEGDVTLLTTFCRYIYTGGEIWRDAVAWSSINLLSFGSFCFYLTYNAARIVLLWKTKKLETEQEVKEVPANFSLEFPLFTDWQSGPKWKTLLKFSSILFWVAVLAVIYNTYNFSQILIPTY